MWGGRAGRQGTRHPIQARLGLGRFEHHVGVDALLAGADQADRTGHAGFEGEVGLPNHGRAAEGRQELGAYGVVVVVVELRGHPDRSCLPIRHDGRHHLRHRRDAVDQRQVHRFDAGPGREHGVGDDQAVGVPHPGQEGQQVGIEDATAEHGVQGTTAVRRSQGARPVAAALKASSRLMTRDLKTTVARVETAVEIRLPIEVLKDAARVQRIFGE